MFPIKIRYTEHIITINICSIIERMLNSMVPGIFIKSLSFSKSKIKEVDIDIIYNYSVKTKPYIEFNYQSPKFILDLFTDYFCMRLLLQLKNLLQIRGYNESSEGYKIAESACNSLFNQYVLSGRNNKSNIIFIYNDNFSSLSDDDSNSKENIKIDELTHNDLKKEVQSSKAVYLYHKYNKLTNLTERDIRLLIHIDYVHQKFKKDVYFYTNSKKYLAPPLFMPCYTSTYGSLLYIDGKKKFVENVISREQTRHNEKKKLDPNSKFSEVTPLDEQATDKEKLKELEQSISKKKKINDFLQNEEIFYHNFEFITEFKIQSDLFSKSGNWEKVSKDKNNCKKLIGILRQYTNDTHIRSILKYYNHEYCIKYID